VTIVETIVASSSHTHQLSDPISDALQIGELRHLIQHEIAIEFSGLAQLD